MDSTNRDKKATWGQKIARTIIGSLLMILLTIGMVEAMLYFLDPLGVVTYLHSFTMLEESTLPSDTGYTFPVGEHQMLNYTFTINEDESRLVPATDKEANCTIAAIGDSLTFGMGVTDDETWVNILAEIYPDVEFLNYGRPVFAAGNVLRSYNAYPADAYIWLIVYNDDFPPREYYVRQPDYPLASRLYWIYVIYPAIFGELPFNVLYENGESITDDGSSPSADVAEIIAENTLIFGFNELPASNVEQAIIIPKYTEPNSPMDAHPSAVGNQQIAEGILPYMDDFIQEQCG